jgi:hypothetical protein
MLNILDLLDCSTNLSFLECCFVSLFARIPTEMEIDVYRKQIHEETNIFRRHIVNILSRSDECFVNSIIIVNNIYSGKTSKDHTTIPSLAIFDATSNNAVNKILMLYKKLPRWIRVMIRRFLGIRDE